MSSKNIFLKFFQGNQPKGASGRRVVGERGSNDLPPGKKGGETMTPDRHYEHKQLLQESVEVRGLQRLSGDQPQAVARSRFQRAAGGFDGAACVL